MLWRTVDERGAVRIVDANQVDRLMRRHEITETVTDYLKIGAIVLVYGKSPEDAMEVAQRVGCQKMVNALKKECKAREELMSAVVELSELLLGNQV